MEISYKIEGLRSLSSMPFIDIKPVTILVGLNNSGKSTFLRSLPLLKQSMNASLIDSDDLIRWNGNLVDFQDFSTSVNRNSKEQEITFQFKISNLLLSEHFPDKKDRIFLLENIQLIRTLFPEISEETFELKEIFYSVSVKEFKNSEGLDFTVFKEIAVNISNINLHCKILFDNENESIKKFTINDVNIYEIFEYKDINFDNFSILINELFLELDLNVFYKSVTETEELQLFDIVNFLEIFEEVHSWLIHGQSKSNFKFMPKFQSVFKSFENERKNVNKNEVNFRDVFDKLTDNDKKKLKNYGSLLLFWYAFHGMNIILGKTIRDLTYLAPVRSIERRHRSVAKQDIKFLDPKGENIPNFLADLGEEKLNEFSDWVEEIYGFGLTVENFNGHISVNVNFDDQTYNVADTGFGVSQVIPVLAQIWWGKNKPSKRRISIEPYNFAPQIIVMEQPELHLHPVQQAQVAEAVCSVVAQKENLKSPSPRFIVETHSEKLVSKFSKLIRANKLKHTDIQVVVFATDSADSSNSTVNVCNFNEDGRLVNWPLGFFNSG